MNASTVSKSRGVGLRRALWAAPLVCVAMGFTLACSGGYGPDDDEDTDVIEDNDTVASVTDTDTVQDKALLRTDLAAARRCQECESQIVCRTRSVSCNPPVFVNGREILCFETNCKDENVCVTVPCSSGASDVDDIDGVDLDDLAPELGDLGGITPLDPVPFRF